MRSLIGDKRGDQNWMLISIIIMVIAAAFIIFFYDDIFGKADDVLGKANDLTITTAACEGYVALGNIGMASFCEIQNKTVVLDGKAQFVNCKYLADTGKAVFESNDFNCDSISPKDFCVNNDLDSDAKVNGQFCAGLIGDTSAI